MTSVLTLVVWSWLMASSFLVSGQVSAYASPLAMSFFRFSAALILMLPFMYIKKRQACSETNREFFLMSELKSVFVSRATALHYLIISGTLVGFFICLFTALQTTTPLNISVLYSLIPIIGAVLSRLWLGHKTPAHQMLGFILGTIAAIIILFSNPLPGHFQWHQGDWIYLVGCLLLALHVVATQKWGQTVPPLNGAFMIMVFGTGWLLPLTLWFGHLETVQWGNAKFWTHALYLTVFTTFLTFWLQQKLVMTVGAKMVLAFTYTIPAWVAIYNSLHMQKVLNLISPSFLIGVLCLLTSLTMISGLIPLLNQKTHGTGNVTGGL